MHMPYYTKLFTHVSTRVEGLVLHLVKIVGSIDGVRVGPVARLK